MKWCIFLRVEQAEGFMGIFLLWATWAHEYKAIFVKIDEHRTKGLEVCDFDKTWSACQ